MKCCALLCSVLQCYGMLCSIVQCSVLSCSVVQCCAVLFSVVKCQKVSKSVVKCCKAFLLAVFCSVVQWYTVMFSEVRCCSVQARWTNVVWWSQAYSKHQYWDIPCPTQPHLIVHLNRKFNIFMKEEKKVNISVIIILATITPWGSC